MAVDGTVRDDELAELQAELEAAGWRMLTAEEEAEMAPLLEEVRQLDGTFQHAHVNIVGRGRVPLELWPSHGGSRWAMAAVLEWKDLSLTETFDALSHEVAWRSVEHLLRDEFPEQSDPHAHDYS